MTHLSLALTAMMALAVPVGADTMTMLLPVLSFPEESVTISTKDCVATTTQQVCPIRE